MTRAAESDPKSLSWKVGGMDCASCAAKIRGAVERFPGVSDVKLSIMSETLSLSLDEDKTKREAIEKRVTSLGYTTAALTPAKQPAPNADIAEKRDAAGDACCGGDGHVHQHKQDNHDHDHASCRGHDDAESKHAEAKHDHAGHDHDHAKRDPGHGLPGHVHEVTPEGASWYQTNKGRLVIATGALLAAAWTASVVWPSAAHPAFIVACLIGVFPVAKRALAAAGAGMPFTIEMLMTIAAIGALFIGAAEEAALVVFLFAVGEVLEGVAADRARASIRALGELVPKTAIVEENGHAAGRCCRSENRSGRSGAAWRPNPG
jgi:Zn2+/Cd2+-exporting ATPase